MPQKRNRKHRRPNDRDPLQSSPEKRPVRDDKLDQRKPEPVKTAKWPFHLKLGLVGLAALAIRLTHVGMTLSVPSSSNPIGDAETYLAWASRIAGGAWYGSETFYQAPCYPYFLAVLQSVGLDVVGIKIVQAILGAAGVVLMGISARNFFSERVGLLSAVMLCCFAPAIYYDGIIQKASLAAFLLCGFLASLSWWHRSPSIINAFISGALLALLMLTRENALLWLPLPAFWTWFFFSGSGRKQKVQLVFGYLAGLAVILLPVAARNASLGGEWSPTTFQAGPNFYIGNNLNSNGVYSPLIPGHETPLYERSDAVRIAEQETGKELSAREVSKFWMARSWEDISAQPGRWMTLMLTKSLMAVNHYEVPDVESMAIYKAQSPALILFGKFWHFGILFPLAIAGMLTSRFRWRVDGILLGLAAVMFGAIVLFFILGRYRLPLVPILIPFSAISVIHIADGIRAHDWNSMSAKWIGPTCLAALVAFLPVHDQISLETSSLMNVAVAAGKSKDFDKSIRLLKMAEQIAPEMPEIHFNMGRALSMSGRPEEAISEYRTALALEPSLPMVNRMLGQLYERTGQLENAILCYQNALVIEPQDQSAAASLQRLLDFQRSVRPQQ